jgi:hypothetical protein
VTTKDEIITIARTYLRDFPKFFQVAFTPSGRTYELGKPNVDSSSLWVGYVPSSNAASVGVISSSQYALDDRNGLLRLSSLPSTSQIMVEGYYYEWLLPSDMSFYADMAINLNTHNLRIGLVDMAPAVADVVAIHALIQALWGLLSEYSRDIDVITSESVHIIASQRYRMVSSLLSQWTEEYNKRAHALNIGLERLEVLNLRRVSRTTNRLVPLYREREVGDYAPIERLWPEIPYGVIDLEVRDDPLRDDVFVDGEPPPDYLSNTGYY